MNVAFDGAYQDILSFEVSGAVQGGEVVKVSDNGAVSSCSAADVFCGVATSVRDGICGVVVSGVCKVKYSSTAPSVGYGKLCADGNGGVKIPASNGDGKPVVIISVDVASSTVEFII